MKTCSTCNQPKHETDFVKNKRTKNGLHYSCKGCHKIAGQKYRENNREIIRKRNRDRYNTERGNQLKFYDHLRNRYDKVAPMIYDMFYAAQQGKCRLCGIHQTQLKNRLSLEHDHKTGEFRGLVCPRCNNVIGWIEEYGLDKVIKYLGDR